MKNYYTELTIGEAIHHCDEVGCVYPTCEESYYIDSNCGELVPLNCADGEMFVDEPSALEISFKYVEWYQKPNTVGFLNAKTREVYL